MHLAHGSRFEFKKLVNIASDGAGIVFISISDTDTEVDEMVRLIEGRRDSLEYGCFLKFKDDKDSFTVDQAERIKELVDNSITLGYNKIAVHCWAGLSRSAAVAKWINDYLELDIPLYNNYTQHNLHVYQTLCSISGVETLKSYYEGLSNEI